MIDDPATGSAGFRESASAQTWALVCFATGALGIVCYFGSVVVKPFPWTVGRWLFFFFGPLSVASAVCLYKALVAGTSRVPMLLGCVLTAISGVIVTVMAVVQDTQFTYFGELLRNTTDHAVKEELERILWGVNVVQSGLDVSWDIFVSLGTMLIALALWSHHLFGKALSVLGILAAASALALNLASYPSAPAESGLVDLGPAVAAWYGAVLLRLVWIRDRL